jgi:ATP-dependent DNA ligase
VSPTRVFRTLGTACTLAPGAGFRAARLAAGSRSRHIRWMTLPRVQPIIPIRRKEPFDDPDWVFELKYDGFRGLCYLERGRCRFVSRNCNVLGRLDALCDQVVAEIEVDDAILYGEVIVADGTGRPVFIDLLRRNRRPPTWSSTFSGSTAPISALCRSASAAGGCKLLCRRGHRRSPRRSRSRAGDASSSS